MSIEEVAASEATTGMDWPSTPAFSKWNFAFSGSKAFGFELGVVVDVRRRDRLVVADLGEAAQRRLLDQLAVQEIASCRRRSPALLPGAMSRRMLRLV